MKYYADFRHYSDSSHMHVNETDLLHWTEQVWDKTLEQALPGGTNS